MLRPLVDKEDELRLPELKPLEPIAPLRSSEAEIFLVYVPKDPDVSADIWGFAFMLTSYLVADEVGS